MTIYIYRKRGLGLLLVANLLNLLPKSDTIYKSLRSCEEGTVSVTIFLNSVLSIWFNTSAEISSGVTVISLASTFVIEPPKQPNQTHFGRFSTT